MVRAWMVVFPLLSAPAASFAQDLDRPKGPDKEIAAKCDALRDIVADKKFERDAEGLQVIDSLLQKHQAGVDPKDEQLIAKALYGVLSKGKLRPPNQAQLYDGAAAALGYFGAEGAKLLRTAYAQKRFPYRPEWVPFRERLLRNLGRTKDESMVKFLIDEAQRNPEAGLQAAAGEALGNFDESPEALRKQIVDGLLDRYGELSELASQLGTNIEAQNARDRLAAVQDKWNTTLGRLTGQNFTSFRDWQGWYNKNKGKPW